MIVGIDPGLSGALFFIDPSHPETGEAVDVPVHLLTRGGRAKREIDVASLIAILAQRRISHGFVEAVASMPHQGLSSTFAFGKCFGTILGVLAARSIPITLVSAVWWKKALGVPRRRTEHGQEPLSFSPKLRNSGGLRSMTEEPRRR